jgi:hypothetical protein
MKYSTVAYTAISMNCTENTITLFLFMGHCLAKASCFDSTIFALSEYATHATYILVVYLCFRAVFKFEGTHIFCSAKGTQFEKFREQFADDERAFGYIRLQVI